MVPFHFVNGIYVGGSSYVVKTEINEGSFVPCVGFNISSNTVIAIYRLFTALCLMENNSVQRVGGLL